MTRKLLDATRSNSVIPIPDSTLGAGLESIKRMTRSVLYARVSSDTQQKEATIESQLFELRHQIAAAGHELVKEYIDDGVSGTVMDRPALEQLRLDAKSDQFDRIYFHAADRIARQSAPRSVFQSVFCSFLIFQNVFFCKLFRAASNANQWQK